MRVFSQRHEGRGVAGVYRERAVYGSIWPGALQGVLFILIILFAIGLGTFAWRLYRAP